MNNSNLLAIIFFFCFIFLSFFTMKIQKENLEAKNQHRMDSIVISAYIKANCDTADLINKNCKVIKANIN